MKASLKPFHISCIKGMELKLEMFEFAICSEKGGKWQLTNQKPGNNRLEQLQLKHPERQQVDHGSKYWMRREKRLLSKFDLYKKIKYNF